ncbi:FAD-dependent monooxygenase [Nocardia gipuzkoensis]
MSEPHVIIVGGGPVGLTAALFLSRAGIPSTVLERERQQSGHPKARGIRVRTMELFTQLGLAEQIRRSALPQEANRFIYCDSVVGEEISRTPPIDVDMSRLSPASTCRTSQDRVHEVLHDAASESPNIRIRAGITVTDVTDRGSHAIVHCDNGETIDGDYVIGADGVGSTIRRALDIRMEGQPVLGYGQSIYWQGDLRKWVDQRQCIQFFTGDREGQPASVASVDGRHRWVTMVMTPGDRQRPELLTEDAAKRVVTTAVGTDVQPHIIDIAIWRISAQVAETWRRGRVFLAGDAAHSFPPTGGFGMNTGIQDVHNLAWKLAYVLRGDAGEALLDSYEAERASIAWSNAAWSVRNGSRIRQIGQAIRENDKEGLKQLIEQQRGHVEALDQDLGFGYTAGVLVAPTRPENGNALVVARTGHRFPETLVSVGGGHASSVLSFAENRFTLVTHDSQYWEDAAATAGVGLAECSPSVLPDHEAALIRPDGIVSWMAPTRASRHQLHTVIEELLS